MLRTIFLILILIGQGQAQETKKEIQDQRNPARFHPNIKILSSIKEYDDVRWCNLTKITAPLTFDLISTFWFNGETRFGTSNDIAQATLEKGKNPGLGVRSIHKKGITGRGVNVAIIDQNLCLNHPEFKGKVVQYKDVGCETPPGRGSMHAPGVMSLLAGSTIGTAPDVQVYFAAAPSWTADAKFQAEALEWIIDVNRSLPKRAKIRVVSVSAAPSGKGSPFQKNNGLWDKAVTAAKKAGLLVLDCTVDNGIIGPAFCDINDPDDVKKCRPGFPGRPGGGPKDRVYAPCSARTTAEEYDDGYPSYQYCGRGGLSWSIPYAAGVLALGWQVKPSLAADEIVKLLFKTAHLTTDGYKIINPVAFIHEIEKKKY